MSDAQSYFELPPKLTGNWLVCSSWDRATPDMLALCEKTKLLTALPTRGFAPQTTVAVADAILLESAAPTNGIAVAVLQQCIAGTAGAQEDLDRVRNRLAKIKKGLQKAAGFPKKDFSPESVALRLASPFVLAPGTAYLPILTVSQQAKANAARVFAAPSGGAAAGAGKDAHSALAIDDSYEEEDEGEDEGGKRRRAARSTKRAARRTPGTRHCAGIACAWGHASSSTKARPPV